MYRYAPMMRRSFLLSVRRILAGLALAWLLGAGTGLLHAAEFETLTPRALPTLTDKELDRQLRFALREHKGKAVVVNFWASWCSPCRDEMPSLQRFANRWREAGLRVITIAVADNPKQIDAFLKRIAVELTVIEDREQLASRAWGAHAVPTTLVLDRRHRLRLRRLGAIDWDSPAAELEIEPLLK